MSLLQKIPLFAQTADQILTIELGGNPYILRVLWNERYGYFSLSISTSDNVPILTNIKMVKNYNLTSRFKDPFLPFGDFYFIHEKGIVDRPTYDDLAVTCNLYYYEPDVEAVPVQVLEQVAPPVIGSIWDSGLSTFDSGSSLWDQ